MSGAQGLEPERNPKAMNTETSIRDAFANQAHWAQKLGSPFTALVCRLLGERLDATTDVGSKVLCWTGDPTALADNLPLRWAGSINGLVLNGSAPTLATLYPPNPMPDPEVLWLALDETIRSHGPALLRRLDKAPQTNEVGRSAALMTGLMTIASVFELPFELFETGCSAGLNLNLDRFCYELGGVAAGTPGSAVQIAPVWSGPPPPAATVKILSTRGVDISPLRVADPVDRELLTAYVWPDMAARLQRVRAAIAIALDHPPQIDIEDAADWVEKRLSVAPKAGVTRVLYSTVAFQYFPAASQARIRGHAAKIGAKAHHEAPFAWLRYEVDPAQGNKTSLRLTLWPDGSERVLGVGHPHGLTFHHF